MQLNTKLTPWERQITKRLKEIKERYDFREHYPDSYKALHEEQSFYYYSEKANKETPHACRGAWLDKINAINNDSKHIRLTPQKLSSNLAERIGTIRKQHVKILIHYLEPDPFFYYWSFSDVLANAISSDEERIALSHAVLQTLYEKGYIEDKMVKHPIAEQILMAVKEEQNPKHIEKLKSEFRKNCAKTYRKKHNLIIILLLIL
ncbi:MAG: hypothetical protein HWD59_10580 [Coxiellaceae bacterium]|nr:MAG: hypothetical protein HWD59_10580 [Coxiellaceae bacterium]